MSEAPTADDYDAADGWDEEQSIEQCPHCGVLYSANGGYVGTVYGQNGREYDHFHDTEPDDGPFFCPKCWHELETNRRAAENATITEWSE